MNGKTLPGYAALLSLLSLLSLLACSQGAPPDAVEDIELVNGNLRRHLVLPAAFNAKPSAPSLLWLSVQYPGMAPRDWQATPRDDEIRILIMLDDRVGSTDSLVATAADTIDPARPGQFYRDGSADGFDIYRGLLDKDTLEPQSVVHVFRDDDGDLVGVTDPGSWSLKYSARTKIGADLQIRYLISKPLGRDFVTINRDIKQFIRSHLKP